MKLAMKKILFLSVIIAFASCARKGMPTGGPKDVDPPVFLKAFPDTLSTNVDVNIKEITLDFDEYIMLKDYSKNVVISPPFEKNPIVTPQATAKKNISIKLQEALQPNTTYHFNFGNAVRDHNEGNVLSDFSYVFSTGNYIDSLQIAGKVKDPYQLKQPEKVIVGLYKVDEKFNDSIPLRKKPYYVARASEDGSFLLNYLAKGTYKIVAFSDDIENSMIDYGKEKIAFLSENIHLDQNQESIQLKLFQQKPAYRFLKAEQKGYGQILFKTEGLKDSLKIIAEKDFKTAQIEQFIDQDSVVFWFNPKKDTLSARNQRLRFDVLSNDKKDVATVLYSEPKEDFKFRVSPEFSGNNLSPNQSLKLVSNAPITKWNKQDIELFRDTVQIPYEVTFDPKKPTVLWLNFEKDYDQKFELNLYPNAIDNIFEIANDTLAYQFSVGKSTDYGNLKLTLANAPTKPFFLQFIQRDGDKILQEFYGKETVYSFPNLEPKEYYFRLLVDENENGRWDTGDYLLNQQAEPVYLYPAMIAIRKLWDANETWVIGEENSTQKAAEGNEKIRANLQEERGK